MKQLRRIFPALALLAATSCAELPEETPQILTITPGPEKRELRTGSVLQLSARMGGRPVTAQWTTSDTAIAQIDATGLLRIASSYAGCGWVSPGDCEVEVAARVDGVVFVQKIIVLPQAPFVVMNAPQLDLELGDSMRLLPRFILEQREVFWCAIDVVLSRDTSIARVRTSGHVLAGDEGETSVDIVLTGRSCPLPVNVPVVVRAPLHTLTILPDDQNTVLQSGESVQLTAQVRNWKGVSYPAIATLWSSSNEDVATVEDGRVIAKPCNTLPVCQATIMVRSGRLTAVRTITVRP
jgi:hypothetical protein